MPSWMKHYPMLTRLWLYRVFRANGIGIGNFAIQWVATSFPQPALALAYTNTLGRVAHVFVGYLAGWLSDRVAPVRLMIASNLLSALFTVVMGRVLAAPYRMPWLIVAVIVWNGFAVVSRAASPSLVPKIAQRDHWPAIHAWMAAIGPIQQFLANGLGGILLAAGVFHAFAASGLALGLSMLFLLTRRPWPAPGKKPKLRRSLFGGISYVWSQRVLRRMVIFSGLLNFGFSFYIGEYVRYLRSSLHLSPTKIGLGLMLSTLGTVVSLVIVPRLLRAHIAGMTVLAPGVMALGLIVLSLWQTWAGFVLGAALVEFGSGAVTQGLVLIRQSVVPVDVMGAVSGALGMFHVLLVPLGMALAGVVAFVYGAPSAMVAAASMVSVATLLAWPYAQSAADFLRKAAAPLPPL